MAHKYNIGEWLWNIFDEDHKKTRIVGRGTDPSPSGDFYWVTQRWHKEPIRLDASLIEKDGVFTRAEMEAGAENIVGQRVVLKEKSKNLWFGMGLKDTDTIFTVTEAEVNDTFGSDIGYKLTPSMNPGDPVNGLNVWYDSAYFELYQPDLPSLYQRQNHEPSS